MTQKRFIFVALILAIAAAISFFPKQGRKAENIQPVAPNAVWPLRVDPENVKEEKIPVTALENLHTLNQAIEDLEAEIHTRQLKIEREQVVKMLNENRINDYERQIYFDLLNAQAGARTRAIELRLKRLRLMVDQGRES